MEKSIIIGVLFLILFFKGVFAQSLWGYYFSQEFLGGIFNLGGLWGVIGIVFVYIQILGLNLVLLIFAVYAFFSLALSRIAKKLGVQNPWFAYIPILNLVLMARLADMPKGSLLIGLIFPVIGMFLVFLLTNFTTQLISLLTLMPLIVLFIIYWIKISRKLGKIGFLGFLMIFPGLNLFILAFFAWTKTKVISSPEKTNNQQMTGELIENQEEMKKMMNYIKRNLAKGYDIYNIRNSLLQQGYDPILVNKAVKRTIQ
jgi:hypothetical protein